jgi:hypothetical protein
MIDPRVGLKFPVRMRENSLWRSSSPGRNWRPGGTEPRRAIIRPLVISFAASTLGIASQFYGNGTAAER